MIIRLNLLPIKEKSHLKKERLYQLIAISLIIFIIGASLVSLELFWAKQFLKNNIPSYDLTLDRNNERTENINHINLKLAAISQIQNEYLPISQILIALSQTTSNNLQLKSFSFSKEKKTFQLNGWSKNREALLRFQGDLEKIKFFKKVEMPISNLVKQKNIDFQFSGDLNLSL